MSSVLEIKENNIIRLAIVAEICQRTAIQTVELLELYRGLDLGLVEGTLADSITYDISCSFYEFITSLHKLSDVLELKEKKQGWMN